MYMKKKKYIMLFINEYEKINELKMNNGIFEFPLRL